MTRKYLFLILSFLLLKSCIPDENPVKPLDRGDKIVQEVTMGMFYAEQIYYSLDENLVLKQNNIVDWDIAMACQPDEYHVILNFGKFMKIAELENDEFNKIDRTTVGNIPEDNWKYDIPNGDKDSTAIGKWWTESESNILSKNLVYIIDRGVDEKGKALGTVKMQIIGFESNSYRIKFANLKDNIIYELTIPKNSNLNFLHLSFNGSGQILELEPPTNSWDILFSKYTELLYTNEGEGVWYSVTGAYINSNLVEVAIVDSVDFDDIDYNFAKDLNYSNRRNIIGHEWKVFDLDNNAYIVNPNINYIIKSAKGFYYKLHFINFYDNTGNRGTPKFEMKMI